MSNIFISYSRTDRKFAKELVSGLSIFDYKVVIDEHDIAEGEDWKTRLGDLIAEADTMIFILSPESLNSVTCQWEVEEATRLKKRIVPVLYKALGDMEPREELGKINYIDFTKDRPMMEGLKSLSDVLKDNLDWYRKSTWLLTLARKWEEENRVSYNLLSGSGIEDAKNWMTECPIGEEVTQQHKNFIKASEEEEIARHKEEKEKAEKLSNALTLSQQSLGRFKRALVTIAILFIGLGVAGYNLRVQIKEAQKQEAIAKSERDKAELAQKIAEKSLYDFQMTQSKFLSDLSRQHIKNGYPATGILLALTALPDKQSMSEAQKRRPFHAPAHVNLDDALRRNFEKLILSGHKGNVRSVAYSPDGKILATASLDKTIKLWDVKTGDNLKILKGHNRAVYSVTFSPDGKTLASGSDDNTIRLWNVSSGKSINILKGHNGAINSLAFSPDGNILATGSDDNMIHLWDVTTGNNLKILNGHNIVVTSVAFSPDGRILASGSRDRTIRLWDIATGTSLQVLNGHEGPVNSLAFHPEARVLASGSDDNTIRLWDIASGSSVKIFRAHNRAVYSVAFSSDGKMLASGSWDNSIRLWDMASGKNLTILKGHGKVVYSLAFSPDSKSLVTGAGDKTARIWSVSNNNLQTLNGHVGAINSLTFSSDGRVLATGSDDNTIRLWDIVSGKSQKILLGHTSTVLSVALSPDGNKIATGSNDNTIRIWEVVSGKIINILKHNNPVYSVAFSPDGKKLATGTYVKGEGESVWFWDVAFAKKLKTLKHISVNRVTFSPDGKILATASIGSRDKTIHLWDVVSGKKLKTIDNNGVVYSLAFSPDGKVLATGNVDGTIWLWDMTTRKVLKRLMGHNSTVTGVAFSPNGGTLATGSIDKKARLWEVATGQPLKSYKHKSAISSIAFSPNGKRLAIGSKDKVVHIWDVRSKEALILEAKKQVQKCLTPSQRKRFYLRPEPPRWCITGFGEGIDPQNPKTWKPKWPYHTEKWKQWQLARDSDTLEGK